MNHPDQTFDLLSEDFADFALDEVEEFEDLADRAEVSIQANGQTFRAKVLGFGSSYKEDDHNHAPGTPPVEKCSSCRWADVAIMRMDEPAGYTENRDYEPATRTYVLATMGKSVVRGEKHRLKLVFTTDPMKVFRGLFVPTRGPQSGPTDKKIPFPNAVALRRAAAIDSRLNTVLEENEAVVPDPEPSGSYLEF